MRITGLISIPPSCRSLGQGILPCVKCQSGSSSEDDERRFRDTQPPLKEQGERDERDSRCDGPVKRLAADHDRGAGDRPGGSGGCALHESLEARMTLEAAE